ncbi:MAG: SAM-dependent methyltransferase [Clostridia bacterium]|nr:SAM-dependent methyltransferase [Clostridia bacterium]
MRIKLTPRLSAAASLVRGGGIVADIGTDHGYLPIYLLQSGKVKGAIAADIGKMPLKNAESSVKIYGLQDKITLRLSDGLCQFSENEADEIVFAGMGGTLIAEKLAETPWVKNEKLHFVFQPQSRAEDLRRFLFENGFTINEEIATHEGRRIYIAFDASYTGEIIDFDYADSFIGKLPHTADAYMHLTHQLSRLKEKYEAFVKCGKTEESKMLFETIEKIEGFING